MVENIEYFASFFRDFPDEAFREYPALRISRVWYAYVTGDYESMEIHRMPCTKVSLPLPCILRNTWNMWRLPTAWTIGKASCPKSNGLDGSDGLSKVSPMEKSQNPLFHLPIISRICTAATAITVICCWPEIRFLISCPTLSVRFLAQNGVCKAWSDGWICL